jgi:protein involved in polysaccharide export with SLBB domain
VKNKMTHATQPESRRDAQPAVLRMFGMGLRLVALSVLFAYSAAAQVSRPDPTDSSDQAKTGENQPSDLPMIPWSVSVDEADGTDEPAMTAEQIISILARHEPLMTTIKAALERMQGVDPGSVTDEEVYSHIRQDDSFREQVSEQLRSRGYRAKAESEDPDNQNSPYANPSAATHDSIAGEAGRGETSRGDTSRGETSRGDTDMDNTAWMGADRSGDRENMPDRGGTASLPYPDRQAARNQPRPAGEHGVEEEKSEPQLRHRRNPYGNLPSLRDLYSQIPPQTGKLRRFGSDTFRLGTGNANELPLDLPVGPDYVLGPGDNLVLNMWGGESQRIDRNIDRQGQLALPEAGTVMIAGLTLAAAQVTIAAALSRQFQNEHVELSLGRLRTVRVYVVGDVQRPGAYDLSSLSTPLNALYTAGGPTSRGSLRILRQYRGQQLVREIDLYEFFLKGVRSEIDRLLPGDTILVPPVGPQVSVTGAVRRPAIYELICEQGLNQVLELAGGTLVSANLKQIVVERVEAHERRTMLSVPLSALEGNAPNSETFRVRDGDNVFVAPILPYNQQVVYLDGHLFRPGKYAYREGLTVNDLLQSYQDVMPEPAEHAEIIRLQAPDFRPQTISFNLSDVLSGDDPIILEPFDVIRVFSRYEIDPPTVSIKGEVLRPGSYPLSQGMTLAGLVRMAGGFKRSAYREEGDLMSYKIVGGEKVLTRSSVIALDKALDGDKTADVVLKPGDVVGIRQLTGWQDIGASIAVRGEVRYAGSYGISEGERLSSVLKRAGGFRDDAYPTGAVLERIQVRELGEKSRQEMIRRIETTSPTAKLGLGSSQDQSSQIQFMQQQQQQIVASLRSHPATGRLVIRISARIGQWENTPADIQLRAGDTLLIPKRPDFVIVSGQVYSPTAISYNPNKDADWYLQQAGGIARSGDKKDIFIVRADGSVVGRSGGMLGGGVLKVRLNPGDSVVIPEKPVGGSQLWKSVLSTAQIMSSVAITGAAAGII